MADCGRSQVKKQSLPEKVQGWEVSWDYFGGSGSSQSTEGSELEPQEVKVGGQDAGNGKFILG